MKQLYLFLLIASIGLMTFFIYELPKSTNEAESLPQIIATYEEGQIIINNFEELNADFMFANAYEIIDLGNETLKEVIYTDLKIDSASISMVDFVDMHSYELVLSAYKSGYQSTSLTLSFDFSLPIVNLADLQSLDNEELIKINVVITGTYYTNTLFVEDSTGAISIYQNDLISEINANVGDRFIFTGIKSTYNNIVQVINIQSFEHISQDNETSASIILDSAIDNLADFENKKITTTLVYNGVEGWNDSFIYAEQIITVNYFERVLLSDFVDFEIGQSYELTGIVMNGGTHLTVLNFDNLIV